MYPDTKGLEIIRELQAEGLKNVLKKDEDNQYFISFHRDPTKMMRGKLVSFAQPKVIDNEGKPMDGNLIGWESDVTCRLEVYKSAPNSAYRYVGARWDSLRVDNLVPWVKEQLGPDEREAHDSLVKAEEPSPW